jgi:hypothetical protein
MKGQKAERDKRAKRRLTVRAKKRFLKLNREGTQRAPLVISLSTFSQTEQAEALFITGHGCVDQSVMNASFKHTCKSR